MSHHELIAGANALETYSGEAKRQEASNNNYSVQQH